MSDRIRNISVLVSGGGTNLQSIIDATESGKIARAKVAKIISSSSKAYALERAKAHGIEACVIDGTKYPHEDDRARAIVDELKTAHTDLVVLAGYMKVLSPEVIREYPGRIINIHPSLIPKHCGKGFYGIRVHESVLAAGDGETGATVHFVDEGVDTGPIILQSRVMVLAADSAENLAARVLLTEHKILIEAINIVLDKNEKGR